VAVLSHPLDETPRRRVPGFYRFPLFGRAHRAAAAVAHGARLVLWQPWRTLRAPLVWILHVGYAWLVVHLAMRALAQFYLVPNALCPHHRCAIGSLTIGIMMRTAKGHTGGPLTVGQLEVLAFLLVQVAAVVRGIRWLVDAIAIHDYGRRFCFLLGGCLCLVRRAVLAPTVAAAVDGKPG